jgi:hypothetical protein
MGTVIAFQTRARSARKSSEGPGSDAQILFFPGVRYMRMDDARAAQARASAGNWRGAAGTAQTQARSARLNSQSASTKAQ